MGQGDDRAENRNHERALVFAAAGDAGDELAVGKRQIHDADARGSDADRAGECTRAGLAEQGGGGVGGGAVGVFAAGIIDRRSKRSTSQRSSRMRGARDS